MAKTTFNHSQKAPAIDLAPSTDRRRARVAELPPRRLSPTAGDAYFAPGKTIREIHNLVQSGAAIDLLKDFSEVAREELRAFTTLQDSPKRLVRFSARSFLGEWILERALDWLGAGRTDHVDEGAQRGRNLPVPGIIEEQSFDCRRPVFQHPDQLP
jgi:hypothetical protein